MDLVEVKGENVYCDSSMVAKKFGVKHADVVGKLKTLEPKMDDTRVAELYPCCFMKVVSIYNGNQFIKYNMTYEGFVHLAFRFNNDEGLRIQRVLTKHLIAGERFDLNKFSTKSVSPAVYIVQLPDGIIKVGKSKRPKLRIAQYAGSIDYHIFPVAHESLMTAEKKALRIAQDTLGDPCVGREYFNGRLSDFVSNMEGEL